MYELGKKKYCYTFGGGGGGGIQAAKSIFQIIEIYNLKNDCALKNTSHLFPHNLLPQNTSLTLN